MKRLLVALAALVLSAAALAYEPKENVVYYLGGDEQGVMEFLAEACPFIDPNHPAAPYMHLGVTTTPQGVEPFCWARLDDGRLGLLLPGPDGRARQTAISEYDALRGPAPKPATLPNPKKTGV